MALSLPLSGSELRDAFDVADLAMGRNVTTLPEAKAAARRTFSADKAVRRVFFVVMRADGELQLVSVGPRSGHKVEWKFGYPPANYFNQKGA